MSLWLPDDKVLHSNPAELKEALDRYRRVLDGSGYAFWEWDLSDDSYRCGGTFWEKLGYLSNDEAVACIQNVKRFIHPADFQAVNKALLDHLRLNIPIDIICRIKAKNGDYWWTQACANSTRNEQGRVTHLSGVNFDISHLKETEEALRESEARHERILSASNDGIWEWSIDAENGNENGFSYTSHSCWQHLGYTEKEVDALPDNERLSIWRSYIHPSDLLKMKEAIKRHFVFKEPFDMEYRMYGYKGQLFWMRARGQAVFNDQGRAILMSGINIDITEIKVAEERVRQAKEDAEKANNAKSHFLSSMSHELRTPLNAIMGFSQLSVHNTTITEEQRDNSRQIYNAGEHLLELINDVLDLSGIEAGKINLDIEPVSPSIIIEECFSLVKPLADRRGVTLVFEPDRQYYNVYADRMRLKQCLLNLLSNAVKYNIENGDVMVTLQIANQQIQINVEDTGNGISVEKQQQLFQPFNRLGVENSTVEGTGIGLVITKELLEKMQGSIRYSQQKHGGSCFSISLPMASKQSLSLSPKQAEQRPNDSQWAISQLGESKRLLYIEDHLSNIHLMEELLKPYGTIDVACHSDPLLGLYNIRTEQPDVIILDINLPMISGLEMVSIIKADQATCDIPVIALSANATLHDVEKGKALGFDEYLTKPLSIKQLMSALDRLLCAA